MKKTVLFSVSLLSLALTVHATDKPPVQKWTLTNPFEQKVFVENLGQYELKEKSISAKDIVFGTRQDGLHYFFTKDGLWIKNIKPVKRTEREIEEAMEKCHVKETEEEGKEEKEWMWKFAPEFHQMKFIGANPNAELITSNEVSQVYNFQANGKPISAHAWKKLIYRNLYPGIDMELIFPEDRTGFKYTFILQPGANPSQIKIKYPENDGLSLLADGNILIKSPFGNFTDQAPIASEANTAKPVDCAFTLNKGTVQFQVANYDINQGLIIDPFTSTPVFTGGNNAYDVDWDNAGNCYVYGGTSPFQVLKFNASGTLQWSHTATFSYGYYYGDFAVDHASGSVYITDGFNGSGAQAMKLNSAGTQVALFNGNSLFQEMWRIAFSKCTNQAVIAGGGTSNPSYTGCYLDTNLTSMNPVNVINSPTGLHDMWGITLDAFGAAYFATAKTQVGSGGYDNIIYKVATPALTPIIWQTPEGYNFVEVASVNYAPGPPNGFNGMVMSNTNLYTYDSYVLKKWNSANGSLLSSVTVNGTSQSTMTYGGITADECDNLFIGKANAIWQYNSALAHTNTITAPNTVYDVSLGKNNMLYSCGLGFVMATQLSLLPCSILHHTDAITNAGCSTNGSATVTVTGGTPSYTINWNSTPPQSGAVLSNVPAGTYIATITDNSCIKQTTYDTVHITSSGGGAPLTVNSGSVCPGGSLTLTASGATSYTWSGSGITGSGATVTATPSVTTVYTVTGSQSGCNGTATATVTVNTLPTVTATSGTICAGQGTATLTASGANTYTWNPGAVVGTTMSASPGATTVYTVTGTATNGCVNTGTTTVMVNTLPNVTSSSSTVCPTGTGTLTASGASTYVWNTGAITQSISAAPASTTVYTVTGTDANGCHSTGTGTITVNNVLNVTASSNSPLCVGSTLNLSTGVGVSWSWTGPNGFSANTQNPSVPGVTTAASGTYSLTATDAFGCFGSTTVPVTINPLPTPVAGSNSPICVNQNLNLTASGGTGYAWSGPNTYSSAQQNPTITSVTQAATGVYTVTVTDANSCVNSATVSVTVNALPVVTATGATVCINNTINLTSTGGVNYTWSGPNAYSSNLQNPGITNASAAMSGVYTVTVVDANNCSNSNTAQVTVNPFLVIAAANNGPICQGATLNLSSNAGVSWSWSGPNGFSASTQNGSLASAMPNMSGTYTVNATDANGCPGSATTSVTVNPLPAPVVGSNSPICVNQNLNLTASGGTGYAWIGPNTYSSAQQNPSITGVTQAATGVYTVTVTDANLCVNSGTVSVTVNPLPVVTATGATVCANNTINLSSTGGVTYSWSGPNSYSSNQQNPGITNATSAMSGNYVVTVTDANNCSNSNTAQVTVNPLLVIAAANNGPLCVGTTLNLSSNAGVSWNWTGPGGFSASTQNGSLANSTTNMSGTYTVTATDANGCPGSATTNVIINPLPVPVAANNGPICVGAALNLTGSGGPGYSWAGPGNFSSNVQNPSIAVSSTTMNGTYTLTVVDGNNCTASATTQVTINPLPVVNANSATICVGNSANLVAGGATTYSWSPNVNLSSNIGNNITANPGSTTNYIVTGIDANGCINTASLTVTVNSLPPVAANTAAICLGQTTGTLTASGANTYVWNPVNGLSGTSGASVVANPNSTMVYTVTGTDMNGCVNTATTTVVVNPIPLVSVTPQSSSGCAPVCVNFANTTGVNGTCNWNFGDGTTSSNCNVTHCFTGQGTFGAALTLTDNNGCVGSATATVNVYPVPDATFNASPQPTTILDPTIHFYDASTGANIVGWSWNFGDPNNTTSNMQNPTHVYEAVGSYPVMLAVVSDKGCVDTTIKIIVIQDEYMLYVPNAFSPNDDGTNDVFMAKGEGIKDFKMYIFDRWGNLAFISDDINKGWDGHKMGGKDSDIVQQDVYVWKIEARSNKGVLQQLSGTVSLLK